MTAGSDVAVAREITVGNLRPTVNINSNVDLKSHVDLFFLNPNHVFASPVLGGQLVLGITGLVGRNHTSLDGTLTVSIGNLMATRQGTLDSSVGGFGDLFPQVSLRWNSGVNNYMKYMKGGIPVGDYDPTRLANLGIGHGAFDGGVGYTYFDPTKGHELSAVAGLTYNFENPDTRCLFRKSDASRTSCPRRRASSPHGARFLDSRFRGNDARPWELAVYL